MAIFVPYQLLRKSFGGPESLVPPGVPGEGREMVGEGGPVGSRSPGVRNFDWATWALVPAGITAGIKL